MMIGIIIRLLSSMMVTRPEGSKSKNKRRALAYCLAHIKILGLVYVRRRKKRNTKIIFSHVIC